MEHADELASTAEVAAYTGRSVSTVNEWARKGKLVPAFTVPGYRGAYMFSRADVEAMFPTIGKWRPAVYRRNEAAA